MSEFWRTKALELERQASEILKGAARKGESLREALRSPLLKERIIKSEHYSQSCDEALKPCISG